jgi:enamine deaminase RidA (YjgF/YER057c/UK114 family)
MSDRISAEARLIELGLTLPEPPARGGNYVSAKTVGTLVYLSGVVSANAEGLILGTAGLDKTVEDGYAAARACALMQLAVLRRHLGSLDRMSEVVSVNGYVNAVKGWADAPKVLNGASDLLVDVFGEAGRHVRAALGVNALPRGVLVEVQMVVSIG